MSDQDHSDNAAGERRPITTPELHPVRSISRAVIDTFVEALPGGPVLAELGRLAHPPKADKAVERWQQEITGRSNEHDAMLSSHEQVLHPTSVVQGVAAQLASALAISCQDGLASEIHSIETLQQMQPEATVAEIQDAVFDLKALGVLDVSHTTAGPRISLSATFYQQIDRPVMGWVTRADAARLAELMLTNNTGHAPDLHALTGWSKRRFNPAFAVILTLFPEGRIRRVHQPDYVALGVGVMPEDRATLRRFISEE